MAGCGGDGDKANSPFLKFLSWNGQLRLRNLSGDPEEAEARPTQAAVLSCTILMRRLFHDFPRNRCEQFRSLYRAHTSCISEAEKYQKSVYKPKKKVLAFSFFIFDGFRKELAQQQKNANTATAPSSAPLIAQLEKKRPADVSPVQDVAVAEPEKTVTKKSKRDNAIESKNDSSQISNEKLPQEKLHKAAKSVLKKNGRMSLSKLRELVVMKLSKKESISKENLQAAFDDALFFGLNEDGIVLL
ncbi:hypothetical protein HDU82_004833 [Entophlyctis luteolus]|nr:hypothetical protein HDU82_004833 [Entophlyctis luteolus]